MAYDFRHRFQLSLSDLGTTVPWDECWLLVTVLIRDPSSWVAVAVNKWHHPITYEWAVLAATHDLLAQVYSKRKPKPYPRPWDNTNRAQRKGTARRDAREILAKARRGEYQWQNKHTPM